jgi:mercuric ion transport protein
MIVELIYSQQCPNVVMARERLLQAFSAAGMTPRWQEWDRNDSASPAHAHAYGSPTILVDGRDVTGIDPSADGADACRVYGSSGTFDGAPTIDSIANALRKVHADTSAQSPRAGWRNAIAALPAVGTAALPKLTCPVCWPAYTALLGAMGVGFINYTPYLLPLTVSFLILSLIALGWRARRRRGYGPLFAGLAASALLLVGKFAFDSEAAMYTGIAILVAASFWNAWPRAQQAAGDCPACDSTSLKLD